MNWRSFFLSVFALLTLGLTAQAQTRSFEQNVEIAADDGSAEMTMRKPGMLVFNRLTPVSYPATLRQIRIYLAQPKETPSLVGQTIRILAFADPGGTGQPPATPVFVVDQQVVVSQTDQFLDYELDQGPTLTAGDWYVGYQVLTASPNVVIAGDANGIQFSRSYTAKSEGKKLKRFAGIRTGDTTTPCNLMIRAVVTQKTPDFDLSVEPGALTLAPGETATCGVRVLPLDGFTGTASLSVAGSAALTRLLSTASLAPGQTASLVLGAPSTLPGGTYAITVEANSGALTRSKTIQVTVQPRLGSFTVNASPASQTISQGGSATYAVTISGTNGFSQSVTVTPGVSDSLITVSPPSVSLLPGATATFTARTMSFISPGTHRISFLAQGGGQQQSQTVSLIVSQPAPGDFSLAITPPSQTMTAGQSALFTVSAQGTGGFAQTITLSASGGLTGDLAATTVSSGSGTNLTVRSTASSSGTYTITVTGRSGSLVHTASCTVTVSASGGGGGCNPDNITVWVNLDSGVYHCPGSAYYGNTKNGTYMSQGTARSRGYRPSNNKACTCN